VVNKAKNKGTVAETLVKDHLNASGFPQAHRSALSGINDIGDIIGVESFTIQVKNHVTPHIPEWLRATEKQRCNGGMEYGVLIVKRQGIGARNVGAWAAVMIESQWLKLFRAAGSPFINFRGRGKSPRSALDWSMAATDVWTLQFRDGVDVFVDNAFETQCRVMSLDGWIALHRRAHWTGGQIA
jgi:hypothetical protein